MVAQVEANCKDPDKGMEAADPTIVVEQPLVCANILLPLLLCFEGQGRTCGSRSG